MLSCFQGLTQFIGCRVICTCLSVTYAFIPISSGLRRRSDFCSFFFLFNNRIYRTCYMQEVYCTVCLVIKKQWPFSIPMLLSAWLQLFLSCCSWLKSILRTNVLLTQNIEDVCDLQKDVTFQIVNCLFLIHLSNWYSRDLLNYVSVSLAFNNIKYLEDLFV